MPLRKLASIQKVNNIIPIPKADRIELAIVQGWSTVVKKGEFSVGDYGVFYEIDSVLPDMDIYRFLWTSKDNPEGVKPPKHRLKSVTLRGFLSQGLLLPLSSVLEAHDLPPESINVEQGYDLTELLGVTKWDPPVPVGANIIGNWNFSSSKTDEERLQSNLGLLDEALACGQPLVMTRKDDGSSVSIGIDNDGNFSVCTRNYSVDWTNENSSYNYIVNKYNLVELFSPGGVLENYILQGELCGPGIQKNPLGLNNYEWHVFNIWDKNNSCYLSYSEMLPLILACESGLQPVSVLGMLFHHFATIVPKQGHGDPIDLEYDALTLEVLLQLAESFEYPGTTNPIEGIVVRPLLKALLFVLY